MTTDQLGPALLTLARGALEHDLRRTPLPHVDVDALDAPGATFVTLTEAGTLRGCIGSLLAWRALRDDVVENARAAAFRDPRFPPLSASELATVRVEVSLLGEPTPLNAADEPDARAQLRPGDDGVILSWRDHRGTFLPQVWEQLPDPADFLAQLKRKAGLRPDFWDADVRLERYGVTAWQEP